MKRGFTLIECLIYIALLSVVGMLISSLCTNFFSTQLKVFSSTDRAVSLYIVVLQITRDIQEGPSDSAQWQNAESSLSWQQGQRYCWKLQEKRLMRTQGVETTACADGIDELSFELSTVASRVSGVTCTLAKQGVSYTWHVPLYAKVFACS